MNDAEKVNDYPCKSDSVGNNRLIARDDSIQGKPLPVVPGVMR